MLLPQSERPSFAPIQHNRQNYSFVYFNFRFFHMKRENKRFWTEFQSVTAKGKEGKDAGYVPHRTGVVEGNLHAFLTSGGGRSSISSSGR
jgi:hypothetical protein